MKTINILSLAFLMAAALLFGGCYTVVEMRSNAHPDSGYNNDEGDQNYQTPSDSSYGQQYEDQDTDSTGSVINNYYGYPPYYGSDYRYGFPRVHLGFYWGYPYYDPFYWDPFSLWSYPYYGYYGYGFGNYPYAAGYYGYYPYGTYYGSSGYHNGYYGYTRSRDTRNIRNNNGLRNPGSRSVVSGTSNAPVNAGKSSTVNTTRNSGSGNVSRGSGNVSRSSGNTRSTGRSYGRGSNYSRHYQMQMREYTRSNNNRVPTYNRNGNSSGQQNSGRYAPQRQSSSGSYSAPRSSSPPPARSSNSGGGGSRSSSGSGHRGR